jgi:phage replication-related protein YjqB (UPF0714/DUF867 family)
MPKDRFASYDALNSELEEGVDFKIVSTSHQTPAAIIAPHGGKIEFMTTEIARAIAGKTFNFYSFVGLKRRAHHEIHITSHKFDEPRCLKTISTCRLVVAIHGRRNCGNGRTVFLGGLDKALTRIVAEELKKSGFSCRLSGHKFPARRQKNICNQGRTKQGCQLELPATLRRRLRDNKGLLRKFSASVHQAIKAHL